MIGLIAYATHDLRLIHLLILFRMSLPPGVENPINTDTEEWQDMVVEHLEHPVKK